MSHVLAAYSMSQSHSILYKTILYRSTNGTSQTRPDSVIEKSFNLNGILTNDIPELAVAVEGQTHLCFLG